MNVRISVPLPGLVWQLQRFSHRGPKKGDPTRPKTEGSKKWGGGGWVLRVLAFLEVEPNVRMSNSKHSLEKVRALFVECGPCKVGHTGGAAPPKESLDLEVPF